MATKKKTKPESAKKTVLQVGWASAVPSRLPGNFKTDEWEVVRLDVDASLKPEYSASILDMKPVKNASVDAVSCSHILQRFFPHEVEVALRECFRVLREGGLLLLSVPNGQIAATYLAHNRLTEGLYTSPSGPITALDMMFGFAPGIREGKRYLAHHTAFTGESLGIKLREAGFTNIYIQHRQFELAAVGYKYGFDHPDRTERITITAADTAKNVPQAPQAPQTAPSTGGPVKQPGKQTDELNVPPTLWQPLGLKKKR